jgi:hypothetical protein
LFSGAGPQLRFGHIPGNALTVEGLQRKLGPLSFWCCWTCVRTFVEFSAVIARVRAIQYSETVVIDREAAAYWVPRLRGA